MSKLNFKDNKLPIIIGSLALVTLMAIIYAVFTGTLNISGTANVRDSKWDIHIVEEGQLDPTYITDSAKVLTKPNASTTSISDFALSLTTPGDTIEYTFNVINEGDYDAEISTLTKNGVTCTANGSTSDPEAVKVCNKLEYTLKYEGGANVAEGDTLLSKETKTMKLTIKYQEFDDPTLLPNTNVSISSLGITLQYSQKGSAKVNVDGTTPYVQTYAAYSVGDTISTHGDSYHVIVDSPTIQDYVVALKDVPLTKQEIDDNHYGQGYINRYTYDYVGQVYNNNGYGGMAYYSSPTCGYATPGGSYSSSGCTTNYDSSDIKHVVDDWATTKFSNNELKEVDGYKARLATKEELQPIGWPSCSSNATWCSKETETPNWIYNSNYWYWTMSQWNNSSSNVWSVYSDGYLRGNDVCNDGDAVRPVLNIYKSKI